MHIGPGDVVPEPRKKVCGPGDTYPEPLNLMKEPRDNVPEPHAPVARVSDTLKERCRGIDPPISG